ncbi:hypothetical protein [Streptomyces sp. NPDC003393]
MPGLKGLPGNHRRRPRPVRASKVLDATSADVDWPAGIVYVVSKGTKLRESIPPVPAFGYRTRLPKTPYSSLMPGRD